MVRSGWSALVHFDDEPLTVVTVYDAPEVGKEFDGAVAEGWVVQKMRSRGGEEFEGQTMNNVVGNYS